MFRLIRLKQPTLFLQQKSCTASVFSRSFTQSTICQRTQTRNSRSKRNVSLDRDWLKPIKPMSREIPLTKNTLRENLSLQLEKFKRSQKVIRKARELGVPRDLFKELSKPFVTAVISGKIPSLSLTTLYSQKNKDESAFLDKAILSAFLDYCAPHLPEDQRDRYVSVRKLSDLRYPSEWFPEARQMRRKIILHVGPTNSGKTYRALKRLESAESGLYCGPLRLLAHEIYEKMNEKGIPCNLLTGEERKEVSEYAPLTSSTVEMASLKKRMDVAVIDEIQLIADPQRGWAWTQALLGLKAKEIHLCGEPSVVPLIKKICKSLEEEVEVNEYTRLTPYEVSDKSLGNDLSKVRKGDCVVAFSRQDIFKLKAEIEERTGLKCAVAYGALPPETRALQAKAFNDPHSGFDVLVASDAVGMGLNLNIKRIIFSTVEKFDGKVMTFLSTAQLKQIAGRAGRFGTAYSQGEVTTLNPNDLSYVKACVAEPLPSYEMAGLQPTPDILELFALQWPEEKFSGLLQKFEDLASLNGDYFLCNYDDQKKVAAAIENIDLPIRDRYQFVTAPVNTRDETALELINLFARKFSQHKDCSLTEVVQLPEKTESADLKGSELLKNLELSHKSIMLYMWLSLRYPDVFVTPQEEASSIKRKCEVMIDEILKKMKTKLVKKHKMRKAGGNRQRGMQSSV
ncbi:P-loop containing nucleoside triphosphate hydrolase protein [Mycotypha africana]|uniref:P-loop containing nucleoside triphosphate hydrolase protein n=1 Tax=Mycotypha africana TaxID=64632 RepID=UPI0023012200|nr:P-loop containing nucleoside triphosphate hydrolase protein [Mycotypha africana]KAI8973805.1 P-loop containing nucleoside triphosphate hydrolase protein [Mycotypha africana]